MNHPYSFLVLTDHRVHKEGNPVYSLLPALRNHPSCAQLHIASRGNPANDPFFFGEKDVPLEVSEVGEGFGFEPSGEQFLRTQSKATLSSYDCILMRLPRPVSSSFFDFLPRIAPNNLFINHPSGIELTSNKRFLLNFPQLCPPMKLCYSAEEVLAFAANFPIVLKPLKEYGGKGIVKMEGEWVSSGDKRLPTIDFLRQQEAFLKDEGYLAMKFLKNVHQGDKRILVVGGEIMGASLRLPKADSWLCNIAQGGEAVQTGIEPAEEEIVRQINPKLLKEGILIYGVDTLVGDDGNRILSEINTLSVGGFANIQALTEKPVIQQSIQRLIDYVEENQSTTSENHR